MNDAKGKPIKKGSKVEFFDVLTNRTLTGKVSSFDGETVLTVQARRAAEDPLGPFQFHANQVTVK